MWRNVQCTVHNVGAVQCTPDQEEPEPLKGVREEPAVAGMVRAEGEEARGPEGRGERAHLPALQGHPLRRQGEVCSAHCALRLRLITTY
jgi:hypothetical protein